MQHSDGWTGDAPETDGEWAEAAIEEKRGRLDANGKLTAVAEIIDGFNEDEL